MRDHLSPPRFVGKWVLVIMCVGDHITSSVKFNIEPHLKCFVSPLLLNVSLDSSFPIKFSFFLSEIKTTELSLIIIDRYNYDGLYLGL